MGNIKDRMDEKTAGVLLRQNLAVLATRGEIYPYTSLVGFAVDDGLRRILFATIKNTRKYENLKKYPGVSILINSGTNSYDDFKDAVSITALGKAGEEAGEERERLQGIYLEKFPFLNDFVKDPACALITVKVDRYILVTRFQEVQEIDVNAG